MTARPLPQLDGSPFLTDGGLETTLVFHDGIDLPFFAAFDLLRSADGRDRLARYYEDYVSIAVKAGTGFILESPTWRANSDWAERMGISPAELDALNGEAIALMREVRATRPDTTMVVSGCVGPRGDGYDPGTVMSAAEAEVYHARQIGVFARTGADMVAAITMTNVPEAIGVARAAAAERLPVAISFTLETDGRLPTGDPLKDAIAAVDSATGDGPAYYMINCAHPTHFADVLVGTDAWTRRICGLRANASRLSHAELDEATELDSGNPKELGEAYRALVGAMPWLNILGGCCGTDHRHVAAIADSLAAR